MGSNCTRTTDITHDIAHRPTTTETRVAYDNSTWHAMNTTYINSTKETSSPQGSSALTIFKAPFNCWRSNRYSPLHAVMHHENRTKYARRPRAVLEREKQKEEEKEPSYLFLVSCTFAQKSQTEITDSAFGKQVCLFVSLLNV